MKAKLLTVLALVAGSGLAAADAAATEWGRRGLGEPYWQPPTYAQPHRQHSRFDDPRARDWEPWDRREPRGHHYGWLRDHHHRRHHPPRRWWD